VDVVAALTDSPDAGAYWRKLKQRLNEDGSEVVTFCHGLKLPAADGKQYETDCANAEGLFRIIQSIPSPKAEPFKRWLAKVGFERVQEIENPELATERTRVDDDGAPRAGAWIGISCRYKKPGEAPPQTNEPCILSPRRRPRSRPPIFEDEGRGRLRYENLTCLHTILPDKASTAPHRSSGTEPGWRAAQCRRAPLCVDGRR